MRAVLSFFFVTGLVSAGCNSTPDHHVICTQAKIRRAKADQGTPNDRQVRCHGLTQEHLKAAPGADHAAFADCVLAAETDEAAARCK